jgi:hypothetical protein
VWPTNSIAEQAELIAIAQKAVESIDATNLDNDWHFTMEIVEDDEVQIIRNNPHGEKYEKRELISVNGNVPDKQRQAEFRESEVKRIDELDPDSSSYSYLVNAATLDLIQASGRRAEFSFRPKVKAMEDMRDQLRGSLLLNLDTGQIEEIEILNLEKLSPVFSVTVESYQLTLRFQLEQGENLLNELESHAKGSMGFLKSFDKAVYIAFSDYQSATP